ANPEMVVRGRGSDTVIERDGARERLQGVRAIEFARDYFRDRELAHRSGLSPLAGGAVGYLAYEAARWFEPTLAAKGMSRAESDDAAWMFYRTVLAFARGRQRIKINSAVSTEESPGSHKRLLQINETAIRATRRPDKSRDESSP